jgi:Flp pilus assembly protein TadG
MKSIWSKVRNDETGSMLVDFALSISIVLMLTFGIMDFSRVIYVDHFVANAARQASRYAMVRGSTFDGTLCGRPSTLNCEATSADISNYVKSIADPGIDPQSLHVVTRWPGTSPTGSACNNVAGNDSPSCVVSVQVSYQFQFVLPFLPSGMVPLTSSSAVSISR